MFTKILIANPQLFSRSADCCIHDFHENDIAPEPSEYRYELTIIPPRHLRETDYGKQASANVWRAISKGSKQWFKRRGIDAEPTWRVIARGAVWRDKFPGASAKWALNEYKNRHQYQEKIYGEGRYHIHGEITANGQPIPKKICQEYARYIRRRIMQTDNYRAVNFRPVRNYQRWERYLALNAEQTVKTSKKERVFARKSDSYRAAKSATSRALTTVSIALAARKNSGASYSPKVEWSDPAKGGQESRGIRSHYGFQAFSPACSSVRSIGYSTSISCRVLSALHANRLGRMTHHSRPEYRCRSPPYFNQLPRKDLRTCFNAASTLVSHSHMTRTRQP